MENVRTIETEEDYQLLLEDVRNRHLKVDLATIDVSNILFGPDEINWDTQCLKITKIDNHEIIDIVNKIKVKNNKGEEM